MNKIISRITILLAAISIFISCSQGNLSSNLPSQTHEKTTVKISVFNNSRTVFPEITLDDFDSFTLRGITEPTVLVNFDTWQSYEQMAQAEIEITKNVWTFILTAVKGQNNYIGVLENVEIQDGTNDLNFTLEHSLIDYTTLNYTRDSNFLIEEGTGSLDLTFSYSKASQVGAAELSLFTEDKNAIEEYQNIPLTLLEDGDSAKAVLVKDNISSGKYLAIINFYRDIQKLCLIQRIVEAVYISDGLVSKAQTPIPLFYKVNHISYDLFDLEWKEGYTPQEYCTSKNEAQLPDANCIECGTASFKGWYLDKEHTHQACNLINHDTHLYAKFEREYTVEIYERFKDECTYKGTAAATGIIGEKCKISDISNTEFTICDIEDAFLLADTQTIKAYTPAPTKDVYIEIQNLETFSIIKTYTEQIRKDERLSEEEIVNFYTDEDLIFQDYYYRQSENGDYCTINFTTQRLIDFENNIKACYNSEYTYISDNTLPYIAIQNYLYNHKDNLTSINLNLKALKDTQIIDDYTYYGWTNLKTFILPDEETNIGSQAFYGTGLKTITIPKNTTFISSGAFKDCEELETVIFEDPENWYKCQKLYPSQNNPKTEISAEALSDSSQAAAYLTNEFVDYYWTKQSN